MSGKEGILKRHTEIRTALRFFLHSWYKHRQVCSPPNPFLSWTDIFTLCRADVPSHFPLSPGGSSPLPTTGAVRVHQVQKSWDCDSETADTSSASDPEGREAEEVKTASRTTYAAPFGSHSRVACLLPRSCQLHQSSDPMSKSLTSDPTPFNYPAPAHVQHSQDIFSTAARHAQHCATQIQAVSSAHQERLTNHLQNQQQRFGRWAAHHVNGHFARSAQSPAPLALTASLFFTPKRHSLQQEVRQDKPWWFMNASLAESTHSLLQSTPFSDLVRTSTPHNNTVDTGARINLDSSSAPAHTSPPIQISVPKFLLSQACISSALQSLNPDTYGTSHPLVGSANVQVTTGNDCNSNKTSKDNNIKHRGRVSAVPAPAQAYQPPAHESVGPDTAVVHASSVATAELASQKPTDSLQHSPSTNAMHSSTSQPHASISNLIQSPWAQGQPTGYPPHASSTDVAPSPWGQSQATGGLQHEDKKAELGRATWLLLHTLAAQYPDSPTRQQQRDVRTMIDCLTRVYPCGECATHFAGLVRHDPPVVSSGREFRQWMCKAHNSVNLRLDKPIFNCAFVDARWSPLACDVDGQPLASSCDLVGGATVHTHPRQGRF